MSETERDSQPEMTIKPKNPKRVEAGKKGAEARRLKKMHVMEVTKPESTAPEKPIETSSKINVYTTYLPACIVMIGIAVMYMYRNKPVQQVNEAVKTDTEQEQDDPFNF